MTVLAGNLTPVGNPFDVLFFARQPEPDLEFTEEELEQTSATRPVSPMKPPKKSGGGRPLLWILLLMLIGGAAYVAMEPEQLSEWLSPLLGESPPPQTAPPVAMRQKTQPESAPPQTAPAAPDDMAATPQAAPRTPVEPPASSPVAKAPAPAVPPPTTPGSLAPSPAVPAQTAASPLFAEGQRVTVMGNPTAPAETVQLSLDPAGSKPGPSVRPGATLSVLDGDLQPGGWVYSVRTDDGLKGWVSEKRLRMKF
jgi:hypothetical protein